MPPSTRQDPAAPIVRAAWLNFAAGPARSIRKLIGSQAERPSAQDWAASTASRKTRRPVWE